MTIAGMAGRRAVVGWAVALSVLLGAGCAGAYKKGVELRVDELPKESLRLYRGCVVRSCSLMIAPLATQEIVSNAQLACLVETDKGTKESDSRACECAHAPSDDARKAACERWVGYVPGPRDADTSSNLGRAGQDAASSLSEGGGR